jgi:hypothetical protein
MNDPFQGALWSNDPFQIALRSREALIKERNGGINALCIAGGAQKDLVVFLETDKQPPPGAPAPTSDILVALSDFIVFCDSVHGYLTDETKALFYRKFEECGAFADPVFLGFWLKLTSPKIEYFLYGRRILKSMALAVSSAFFSRLKEEDFMAELLRRTNPYFHDIVKKIMEEEKLKYGQNYFGLY